MVPAGNLDQPRRTSSRSKRLVTWILAAVGGLVVAYVVVGSVLFRNITVPTGAMEPTVLTGDRLLTSRSWDGNRGAVIMFRYPGNRDQTAPANEEYYLKRCVAVAGDTIAIHGGVVTINGRPGAWESLTKHIDMPMPSDDAMRTFPPDAGYTRDEWGPMRVPRKGDAIPLNDSTVLRWRTFVGREGHQVENRHGTITVDGAPATMYTVSRDYCFGLGDNRNNSLDGRYWGFIPVDDVVGAAEFVLWSKEPDGPFRWNRIFRSIQ